MEKFILDKTISLEFYIDNQKKILVRYNNVNYDFIKFWKRVENAPEICRLVYNEIMDRFPDQFEEVFSRKQDWKVIFLKFINKYFYLYDDFLDVLIKRNGEVTINLEA